MKGFYTPRKVALDILKPTPKQLEHGLQLHADSLVFDSYGFAPRAAIDGDRLATAIKEHASTQEIQDLKEDMSMTRCVTDPAEQREFKEAFDAAGVTCIFQKRRRRRAGPATTDQTPGALHLYDGYAGRFRFQGSHTR